MDRHFPQKGTDVGITLLPFDAASDGFQLLSANLPAL